MDSFELIKAGEELRLLHVELETVKKRLRDCEERLRDGEKKTTSCMKLDDQRFRRVSHMSILLRYVLNVKHFVNFFEVLYSRFSLSEP